MGASQEDRPSLAVTRLMPCCEMTVGLEGLQEVAQFLLTHLASDAILFLEGDLAAGKTTLVSQIVRARGYGEGVSSPTFALQQCYGEDLYHYDLYRIDTHDFFESGLHEELDRGGWHLIEWADAALQAFLVDAGYNTAKVSITPIGSQRHYLIEV
jgi:tRNA threonylcarbamoyladenosine biosynthesis protein TsaE